MNLNPIVKFEIDCPIPAENCLRRIESVTDKYHLLKPDLGFSSKQDRQRYVGKVAKGKFRIRTRPVISLQTFFFHNHRQIVISGKLENRGPKCLVNVTIRPITGVLAGWLVVLFGLIMILARIADGLASLVDWIFLAFFAIWVYTSIHVYISSYITERAFLESLLSTPEKDCRHGYQRIPAKLYN